MTYEELFYLVAEQHQDWKWQEITDFIESELFSEKEVMDALTTVEPRRE